MDVVSSVGAIVGLVFNFAKAIKTCHDIKGRYEGADETIASVKDELETLQGALKQLMELMVNDAAAISSRWDQDKHLPRTFAGAMRGFERTILVLTNDLKGLHSAVRDGGNEMGRGKKAVFVWNENALNGHCVQLRSQAGALHFLLTVLQTGSMSEVKTNLNDLKVAIEKLSLSSNNIPDELLPAYTAQCVPSPSLIDYQDDLMDISKSYPAAQMDSPPSIQSEHGEILRRALTPNTTGESSKSGMKGKGRNDGAGLGITRQQTLPSDFSYLPEKFDEFGPLPKKPLVSQSPHLQQHRPHPSKEPMFSSESIPPITPKHKVKIQSRSTLEHSGVIHSSPESSDKSIPVRQKSSRPAIDSQNKTPEATAIERRLADLRQAASSREKPPEIIRAVNIGDVKTVARLLNSGHDIEARHPTKGATPLILAASLGYFEMLELLMDKGANRGAVDCVERSALHYAASENHPECTELLLAYGAPPDLEDQEKETPLHRAVRYLRSETVEVLLGWSKNPLKQRNLRNQTALHLAARNRGLNIIEKICDKAKKVEHLHDCSEESSCSCPVIYQGTDTEDDSGDTALQSALFRRSMDAVSLLLKYNPEGANAPQRVKHWSSSKIVSQESIPWERPLHYAVRGSSKTLVKRLLDAGADVNLSNSEGQTPLEVAVLKRNMLAIRTLLSLVDSLSESLLTDILTKLTDAEFAELFLTDQQLTFSKKNSPARRLLRQSIASGEWEKLHHLLSEAVSKEEVGKALDEEKALEIAILNRAPVSVISLILSNGASVNTKIYTGRYWKYALHLAAEKNDIPLAEVLLKYGAKVGDEDSKGLLPFHSAIANANEPTIRYFYNATTSFFPTSSSSKKQIQGITETAIVLACQMGSLKILEFLLPQSPTAPSKKHLLHTAVSYGRINITEYLLNRGSNPLGVDEQGKTAREREFIPVTASNGGAAVENTREEYEKCKELVREAVEKKKAEFERHLKPLLREYKLRDEVEVKVVPMPVSSV